MAEKVIFETGKPELVALRYPEGKEVEGRWGTQYLYSLADGRVMYAEGEVAAQITQLGIQPGELIAIEKGEVKEGKRRTIVWRVTRAAAGNPAAGPVAGPAPAATTTTANHPQSSTPAAADAALPLRPGITLASQQMAAAMIAAIDALRIVCEYGKAKGLRASLELDFNAEDVRALANTAIIQLDREAERNLRARNDALRSNGSGNGYAATPPQPNGGTPQWPR